MQSDGHPVCTWEIKLPRKVKFPTAINFAQAFKTLDRLKRESSLQQLLNAIEFELKILSNWGVVLKTMIPSDYGIKLIVSFDDEDHKKVVLKSLKDTSTLFKNEK